MKDMKTRILLALLLCANVLGASAQVIYDEEGRLEYDETWKRTLIGYTAPEALVEISGLACSRVTPGYLWAQGDDTYKVQALKQDGNSIVPVSTIRLANSYRDWEDICCGVYNDTNYVFVGIFGDNSRQYKDKYYIYYFKEPEIVEGEIKVDVDTIHFGYPDGEGHNAETLMYDNVDQVLYIVDKYGPTDAMGVIYSLPFRRDYEGMQVLTEWTKLGSGDYFLNPTGGDISPDGKHILVKNEAFMLIWHRAEGESVADAMARRPKQVKAYKREGQGEAIAWLDSTTFYTTSDDYNPKVPVYMYTKQDPNGIEDILTGTKNEPTKFLNKESQTVQILHEDKVYSLLGNVIE